MSVHSLPTSNRAPPVDPPGGGGDNGGMEARVAKLEATIPNLATKIDVAELRMEVVRVEGSIRSDMHKEFNAQTWRIIGAMVTFGSLLCAATFFIVKNVK